ncbi:MAG: sigma-54-dependent Fis family transcriptional regulator [Phycisphaeraceae bacterium]|nr:MAG: sigma-54-dependent Fis family transcriptional regulator [Phycisphaeraceae bacterium]
MNPPIPPAGDTTDAPRPDRAEPARRALVVDDDPIVRASLADFLGHEGLDALGVPDATAALDALAAADRDDRPFALAIIDVALPGRDGVALLRDLARDHPAVACVMLTGYGSIESAVDAMRHGAVDYLTKPAAERELRQSVERAMRHHALASENTRLKRLIAAREGLASIAGDDPRMRRLFDTVRAVAPAKTTVLMTGESGTGKSLIAHAIHDLSPRRARPFVELSCGSIPETLLESELFGHVKGAFTGAYADKVGRFEAAEGGTIFLDEINSASPAMQLKLLRVLQERKFEPVGSTLTKDADVRVILAANHPLEDLVARGLFRQDLYYRIAVMKIEVPPLRERPGDIPLLAGRFLARYAHELGKSIVAIRPDALAALVAYPFPGNVRELQNLMERAAVLCRGQTLTTDDLPAHVAAPERPSKAQAAPIERDDDHPWTPMPLEEALRDPERRILLRALRANQWNRQKTADQLGINRTTLYKKLRALGIEPGDRLAG